MSCVPSINKGGNVWEEWEKQTGTIWNQCNKTAKSWFLGKLLKKYSLGCAFEIRKGMEIKKLYFRLEWKRTGNNKGKKNKCEIII